MVNTSNNQSSINNTSEIDNYLYSDTVTTQDSNNTNLPFENNSLYEHIEDSDTNNTYIKKQNLEKAKVILDKKIEFLLEFEIPNLRDYE
ncbi:hypothetical protein HERIO_2351 [Hepatospora eriocheir]|uniref:Uncharacterized protein n=1 Tax=Hepatospora eriocheir TaxID=1081669 RepID=A0A1X0Q785_9MICR|nr:hypothetical protein HERIO_2351 [Hepatospora eriocheir]